MAVMTTKSVVRRKCGMGHIFRAVAPYIVLSVIMLAHTLILPAAALSLPDMLR
jgi:TRAP-type mannitol/chloroaromatic compound transport system permease large subunit